MTNPSPRYPEVDLVKAVGILAVILIHAMRSPWDPGVGAIEIWLGKATRFAVPGFLAASGYLYSNQTPPAAATTLARLRRIILPYVAISLAAQIFHVIRGEAPVAGSRVADLLLAASFGPYYYVLVIAVLVPLVPIFARLSPRTLWLLWGAALSLQAYLEVPPPSDYFWYLRNPLLWIAYFQLGWLARLHRDRLAGWIGGHRAAASTVSGSILVALLALATLDLPAAVVRTATWLGIYASLLLIFSLGCGERRLPAPLRGLSDASYAIYLLHLFFVVPVREQLPGAWVESALLMVAPTWLAGLAGSLAVIAALRRLLGTRSRPWIGA